MSADLFYYEKPDNSDSIWLEEKVSRLLEISVCQDNVITTISFPYNKDNKKVVKDFASSLLSWVDREI